MTSTTDTLLVIALLVGMALFGLGLFGAALRFGPRRGTWNQPAAALVRPGRVMFASMYALAAVHVVLGLIAALALPGGGIGVLGVLVAMGSFYVLCAHSFALAHAVVDRRSR